MKILGIKISAERYAMCKNDPDTRYEGYWYYRTKKDSVLISTGIIRRNRYDAEHDAILNAKRYSKQNNVTFITEGYEI